MKKIILSAAVMVGFAMSAHAETMCYSKQLNYYGPSGRFLQLAAGKSNHEKSCVVARVKERHGRDDVRMYEEGRNTSKERNIEYRDEARIDQIFGWCEKVTCK